MEFKHRGVDDESPAYYRPQRSADQAMQGFLGSDLMNIRMHEAIQVEKMKIRQEIIAFQREIEKEQIRQEIIAAETASRRQLVAEVMREMAMEREIAMGLRMDHRFTYQRSVLAYQPRTICPSNMSQSLPLSAGNEGKSCKDKLIVLDKPNQDRFRAKCTAVVPPADGVEKLILIGKKPKEEWSCALCRVSATNERGFNEHLQGKKHKAKEAALRAETMVKKSGSLKWDRKTSSKLTEAKGVDKAKEVGPTSKPTGETLHTASSNTADAEASAITVLLSDATQGSKTEDAVQKEAKIENPMMEKARKEDQTVQEARGENQMVEGERGEDPTVLVGRGKNPTVKEVRAEDPRVEEPSGEGFVAEKVKDDGMLAKQTKVKAKGEITPEYKRKFAFWCDICDIGTLSQLVMEAHLLGKKHKARIQKLIDCPEVVPTTTTLSSEAPLEAKTEDAAPEEAKIENPTVEKVRKEDQTAQEARGENQTFEGQRGENPVADEAKGDDPKMYKVRVEGPSADESRGEGVVAEKEKEGDMPTKETKVEAEGEIMPVYERKFDFWCYICNVGSFSQAVTEAHLQGKKHKAQLQKQSGCSEAVPTITMLLSDAPQEGKAEDSTPDKADAEDQMIEKAKSEDLTDEERERGENNSKGRRRRKRRGRGSKGIKQGDAITNVADESTPSSGMVNG